MKIGNMDAISWRYSCPSTDAELVAIYDRRACSTAMGDETANYDQVLAGCAYVPLVKDDWILFTPTWHKVCQTSRGEYIMWSGKRMYLDTFHKEDWRKE